MTQPLREPFVEVRAPSPPGALRERVLSGVARELRRGGRGSASFPSAGDFLVDRVWECGAARLAFAAAATLVLVANLSLGEPSSSPRQAVGFDGSDWRAAFTAVRSGDEWYRLEEPFWSP